MQHPRNSPLIAVICEASQRGTVEQFVSQLLHGFSASEWKGSRPNPFEGGLIGKFRLQRPTIEYEEVPFPSAEDYRAAIRRLVERTSETPDLAIVQIRESFKNLAPGNNPYLVSKADLMTAGVPTQAVLIEKMRLGSSQLPYLLNTVALSIYAKLEGIPWVISTRGTTTHELIVGMGSSQVLSGRNEPGERYVGISTIFQGDGRYLVWNQTREVGYGEYPDALVSSIRTAIKFVEEQQKWEEGDNVRLICHVYKRLKDSEAESIQSLLHDLLKDSYDVEVAFLDISSFHNFQIIAPKQQGFPYRAGGRWVKKGVGVPDRGLCLQLDQRRVLLQLTGPGDLKTDAQGLPRPLLLELHPSSDFTDITYLARQVYHLAYASWQSFFPASEPVTIKYSRLIAKMLGNMRAVSDWNSTHLSLGTLRNRCWFL